MVGSDLENDPRPNAVTDYWATKDIKEMIGHEPHRYWKIMWKFVAPVFIAILLGATLVSKFLKPITYNVYSYTEVI